NSTLVNNTAVNGGAVCFTSMTGTVTITNSTIAFNTANSTTTTAGSGGGGINRNTTTAATLNISGSIVAGNVPTANAANADASSAGTGLPGTRGNTLAGKTNTTGTPPGPATTPQWSPRENYGITTPTMVPPPASPAINLYSPGSTSLDQRGKTRPATNADAGA